MFIVIFGIFDLSGNKHVPLSLGMGKILVVRDPDFVVWCENV